MTDRELLEAAAKAAGVVLLRAPDGSMRNCTGLQPEHNILAAPLWYPLTDDGDALRLAVALGLFFKPDFFHFLSLERFVGQNRDDCHATRRAIVRAAAAIQRAPGGAWLSTWHNARHWRTLTRCGPDCAYPVG